MPQMKKRKRSVCLSPNAISLKPLFKNKKSINSIDNLSNEIFYEIFNYLDGCDIYQAFSNLNIQFQNLLTHSSLLLKIQFSPESESEIEYRYKQFIHPNKQQIISLHFHNEQLINKFFTLCTLDSSFKRLESIFLCEISTFKLLVLLFYFKSLPCLFSLSISLQFCPDDIGDIYRLIFQLPVLKYFKLDILDNQLLSLTLPMASEEQQSSIEYLSICHYCSLNKLTQLLSYTPRLAHLHFYSVIQTEEIFQPELLISLPNLVDLRISLHCLTFDQFEEFLLKICSQLTSLSITAQSTGINYLDGNRWERLIVQNIPYLTKFIFSYSEDIDKDLEITPCHALINRFISPFWSNRQCFCRVIIEDNNINYLVHPYRDTTYLFQEHNHFDRISNKNISIDYYSDIQIFITKTSVTTKNNELFLKKISPLFKMIEVTRLVIECNHISADTFIKILNLLPNLDLLKITLSSPPGQFFLSKKNNKNLRHFLDKNKITKLTLTNICTLEYIYFMIDLFPRVRYLALQHIADVDLEMVIRYTLRKIKLNHIYHPMTLCVIVVGGTNDKVQKLHKMIDSENLLKDYTIDRQFNNFYLQWK